MVGALGWRSGFALGTSGLTEAAVMAQWESELFAQRMAWFDFAPVPGVRLETRRVPPAFELPARLVVDDVDAAVAFVGGDWPERVARGRVRADLLTAFPAVDHATRAAIIGQLDPWEDVEVDLLLRAARWFAEHPDHGLTARQVPVEGMGSKWLDQRGLSLVQRLIGLEDLGLRASRPPRVHLTYLDPDHLAAGGRRFDVATLGDGAEPAYRPGVVLISENRDTAQCFPEVPGGIAIEGSGAGGGTVAALAWVHEAPVRLYWGDLDAAGLEILAQFRRAGLDVDSILMDVATYRRWERFGVDHGHDAKPVRAGSAGVVHGLRPAEQELYDLLCDPARTTHARVEQERIPLAEAHAEVLRRVAAALGRGS